jgi:hypothetical protein
MEVRSVGFRKQYVKGMPRDYLWRNRPLAVFFRYPVNLSIQGPTPGGHFAVLLVF